MKKFEMSWQSHSENYERYLTLERNFSSNSIESYLRDLRQFTEYSIGKGIEYPEDVSPLDIHGFMSTIYDKGIKRSSQARVLSGLKAFYNYLLLHDIISKSPLINIESPRQSRTLPDVLSVDEIDAMIDGIDDNHEQCVRNKAILETIYSCGIRVSELVSLNLNDIFFNDGFIRVTGKGRKQRIVPISERAISYIEHYIDLRLMMKINSKHQDILFLNRRGSKLTRVMIHTIVSQAAKNAGITKSVGPHTLRHSFATHLLTGGANIRQVQDLLGHESVITTEIYTHLDMTNLSESLEMYHPLKHK